MPRTVSQTQTAANITPWGWEDRFAHARDFTSGEAGAGMASRLASTVTMLVLSTHSPIQSTA
jgi:hypothetical protein